MRRRVSAAAILLLACVSVARAEWTIGETRSEFAKGQTVEHRHLVLRSANGEEANLDLAIFLNKNATLRVIDDEEANDGLAATMQHENCIAGVNGGYFDPNYAPVGLMITNGRVVTPLGKARLLSGVLSVVNG